MSNELLFVVLAQGFSALCVFAVGLFVLLKNPGGKLNRLFAFVALATLLDAAVTVTAELQTTYAEAYFWWTANVEQVFIAMAVTHLIFAVAERDRAWRPFIIVTYVVGAALILTTILEPHWFQASVIPKLYFHYYLSGSWLYNVMLVYFFSFPLLALANLVDAYRHASGITQKRYEYVIFAMIIGYSIAALNFPIVFNVYIDPFFGTFIALYLIPIAYGIFSVNLWDVRIIARRTISVGVIIAGVVTMLALIPLADDYLQESSPGLNLWLLPLLIAGIAGAIGWLIWRQGVDAERLKYEFVTIAAHKLRSPLARIRWTTAELKEKAAEQPDIVSGLDSINAANERLIELTSLLMEVAQAGNSSYQYEKKPIDLNALAGSAVERFKSHAADKHITLTISGHEEMAIGDTRRVASVMDVFLENAITYTPEGGAITVAVGADRYGSRFSVADSGIGISIEDRRHIFKSFFRTEEAKTNDTEGFGLGLTLAKSFIEHQHGSIGFDSSGEGQGSTFWFTLPAASEQA